MISGCAQNAPQTVAVDHGRLRCPPIAAGDGRPLAMLPLPAPEGDLTGDKLKAWVDGLGGQVRAMNKAGSRVTWQYNRCRGDAVKRAG